MALRKARSLDALSPISSVGELPLSKVNGGRVPSGVRLCSGQGMEQLAQRTLVTDSPAINLLIHSESNIPSAS